MEQDRAEVNVGIAVDAENTQNKNQEPTKHPVKRFVGRKTAAAKAQTKAEGSGHIEDGRVVQGFTCHTDVGNRSTNPVEQLPLRDALPECSTKYHQISSMILQSMMQSHSYRPITPSRFTKQFIAFDRWTRRKWLCSFQKDYCFSPPPSLISSPGSAQVLTP